MKSKPILFIFLTGGVLLLFSACRSDHKYDYRNGYTHSGIYFGKNFSSLYKQGIRDGCTTAKGNYTKSHRLFNQKTDYHEGWFLGRNKCRHQKIPEL